MKAEIVVRDKNLHRIKLSFEGEFSELNELVDELAKNFEIAVTTEGNEEPEYTAGPVK